MKHYIAVIDELASGDGYLVQFPGIGLGFTQSVDGGLRGVIAQATEYLQIYAQDRTMPEPLEPPQVSHEARNGNRVFFAAIPLFIDDNRTVKITITIPADIKEAVDYTAKQRGQTRSGFMVSAARAAMEVKPCS